MKESANYDLFEKDIVNELKRLRGNGRKIPCDLDGDVINSVFIDIVTSDDYKNMIRKSVDKVTKCSLKNSKHNILRPKIEDNASDIGDDIFTSCLDFRQTQAFINTYNLRNKTCTKMMQEYARSAKNDRNFWRDTFKDMDMVQSAIKCIYTKYEFYCLKWDGIGYRYDQRVQLKDHFPICGKDECFTITRNDSGYYKCNCYRSKRYNNGLGKREWNGLPSMFSLFLNVDPDSVKFILIDKIRDGLYVDKT